MPNWCENHLSIYGSEEEMNRLIEIISKDGGEFELLEKLYPTPEDLLIGDAPMTNHTEQQKANLEKHGYTDWYQWRVDNWGTKWAENDLRVEQELTTKDGESCIAFGFDTAWGPPLEAFDKISKDFSKIAFCLYYEEPGMGFCGRKVWANGELMESQESEMIGSYFEEEELYNQYIKENK